MSTQTYWSNGVFREVVDGLLRKEQPKADGIARWWHANGALAKEWTMRNGKVQGVIIEWHENGKIARETPYENGIVNGMVKQWNAEGKLLGEYEMKMGRGIKREWYDDGSPSLELEELTENATMGKVWDDVGKAREMFLWNGKPISKKKFHEKLAKKQADF